MIFFRMVFFILVFNNIESVVLNIEVKMYVCFKVIILEFIVVLNELVILFVLIENVKIKVMIKFKMIIYKYLFMVILESEFRVFFFCRNILNKRSLRLLTF